MARKQQLARAHTFCDVGGTKLRGEGRRTEIIQAMNIAIDTANPDALYLNSELKVRALLRTLLADIYCGAHEHV
jgi:hypothetical protein